VSIKRLERENEHLKEMNKLLTDNEEKARKEMNEAVGSLKAKADQFGRMDMIMLEHDKKVVTI